MLTQERIARMRPAMIEAPPGMVHVPGGPFLCGREKREVTIPSFFIDITPVTNLEWHAFVGKLGLAPPRHWPQGQLTKELEECPVIWVTYEDAEAYAKWAGKALQTPMQWEKAARGTDGRKYAWGADFNPKFVNTKEAGNGKPVATTLLKSSASPYGVLGLGGNVMEWTQGLADPKKGLRVVMGSSYRHYLGAAYWQNDADPKKATDYIGFRCVKPGPEGK
jgi:formylglycine-generating enzyme required for sulfatase activity